MRIERKKSIPVLRDLSGWRLAVAFLTLHLATGTSPGANSNAGGFFSDSLLPFIDRHCLDCHDVETAKGEVKLEDLQPVIGDDQEAELWKRIMEQIAFGEMPPKKKPQPDAARKDTIVSWIENELTKAGHRPDLREKLRSPEYGNYVDHEKLFDGSIADAPYTPARLWKRRPQIFDAMVDRGMEVARPQSNGQRPAVFSKVKQPFTLEDRAGIRDYAAITLADSATLGTMMRNADVIVEKMLAGAVHEAHVRDHGEIPEDQLPKDKRGKPIRPRFAKTPEPFREIVLAERSLDDSQLDAAVTKMFDLVIEREPSADDMQKYRGLIRGAIEEAGIAEGLRLGLKAITISPEAIYRSELGSGPVDRHGRRLLGPADLAYTISFALTDARPDAALLEAARSGRLASREDAVREVTRLWDDADTAKPRILQFFHEFFGYEAAPGVFKDAERFKGDYRSVPELLVKDADTLVLLIVKQDRDVLAELLTTDRYFVAHDGDNEAQRVTHDALRQFYEFYKDKGWRKFEYKIDKDHMAKVRSIHRMFTHANGNVTKRWMNYLTMCDENGLSHMAMSNHRHYISAYNLDEKTFSFPVEQPFSLDPENRIGILMHPAWLLAHSLNLDNDPVRRGKWIRERLLAGTVPELPITVDATIPEEPEKSLRERFAGIRDDKQCWRCHVRMNPLGMTFESFDDFGRHRRGVEMIHAKKKSKPVDSSGALEGTGDPALDGPAGDPLDLIRRVAKSDRARQSFVRHAFRFWMGRNERLSDSPTLIAADRAYVENGGSFRALVISLLSSDSFLYRKTEPPF